MKANEFVNEEHLDHEVKMAKSELMTLAQDSVQLVKLLNKYASEERGIPAWVASKITKAQDYINSVHKTLTYDAMKTEKYQKMLQQVQQPLVTLLQ